MEKTVYIGSTRHDIETENGEKSAVRMVCEITERSSAADGQMLFMPVRHSTIKRRRIRTIIDNLILIAGHLTVHARKICIALGRSNGWIQTFLRLSSAF